MNRIVGMIVCMLCTAGYARAQAYVEQSRFPSAAARQAVAVGPRHVYAINNTAWVKYTLAGDSVGAWNDTPGSPLKHMNSGVVVGRRLYCAHSNYPGLPMSSSVEIFDTRTLRHAGSVSFGIETGSCTWVLPARRGWYVFFAHYENKSRQPGCGVGWSQLVEYDKRWRKLRAWVLPAELLSRVRPYSLSGAVLVGNVFYCTGHDARECYLLRIPAKGSALEWVGTVPIPFGGQGIAMDRDGGLWGISRTDRQVIRAVSAR